MFSYISALTPSSFCQSLESCALFFHSLRSRGLRRLESGGARGGIVVGWRAPLVEELALEVPHLIVDRVRIVLDDAAADPLGVVADVRELAPADA